MRLEIFFGPGVKVGGEYDILTFNFLSSLEQVKKICAGGCTPAHATVEEAIWWMCKQILLFCFGPNKAFGHGLRPGPSQIIRSVNMPIFM